MHGNAPKEIRHPPLEIAGKNTVQEGRERERERDYQARWQAQNGCTDCQDRLKKAMSRAQNEKSVKMEKRIHTEVMLHKSKLHV